jgi:hypothetical protein
MIGGSTIRVGVVVLAIGLLILPARAQPAGPTLTVAGTAVQIDGKPAFLIGVSLFDALGAVPPRDLDLEGLKSVGVNTIRVWAHWHEAIYQGDGALSAPGRERLLKLVTRLQSRGLILELVLLRPGQLPGQPFAVFASEAARTQAVEAMTTALQPFRNVLFDLYNEHDHADGPISHAVARVLRDKVKAIDGARVVTLSSTGSHLMTEKGEIDEERTRNLQAEAGRGGDSVAVDILAPHFPRTADWASATAARVGAIRAALERIGSQVPIYLNEERRADGESRIQPDAYQRALAEAKRAGAGGWLFHTAAGFDLKKKAFLDALSAEERAALELLRRP